jgi:hypothetical protein
VAINTAAEQKKTAKDSEKIDSKIQLQINKNKKRDGTDGNLLVFKVNRVVFRAFHFVPSTEKVRECSSGMCHITSADEM